MSLPTTTPDPESATADPLGDWFWCSLCSRCSRRSEVTVGPDLCSRCSYEDCDGVLAYHGWPWESVRSRHPEFPETPDRGVCYEGPLPDQHPSRGPCAEE